MLSPTTSKLTELEIIIPKDKFNDMGFIFRKLMETSLDVLDTIAKNSDKELVELAREFLPDLKNLSQPDIFLSKWGLTMSMLEKESNDIVNVEPDVVSTTTSVSSKKKVKRTFKVSKKVKKPDEPIDKDVPIDTDASITSEPTEPKTKKVAKKLKKIKLSKNSSSEKSVSSDSTTSSKPKKKKLKLKKMKITKAD